MIVFQEKADVFISKARDILFLICVKCFILKEDYVLNMSATYLIMQQ